MKNKSGLGSHTISGEMVGSFHNFSLELGLIKAIGHGFVLYWFDFFGCLNFQFQLLTAYHQARTSTLFQMLDSEEQASPAYVCSVQEIEVFGDLC